MRAGRGRRQTPGVAPAGVSTCAIGVPARASRAAVVRVVTRAKPTVDAAFLALLPPPVSDWPTELGWGVIGALHDVSTALTPYLSFPGSQRYAVVVVAREIPRTLP